MGVDRRRFFEGKWASAEAVDDDGFERDFQRFLHGEISTTPISEEIERIYRTMHKRPPTPCPHGKTFLTCAQCYLNSERGYFL